MTKIKVITYAERMMAFFTGQLIKANRSLDNVVKYGTDPDVCAEKGEIVAFYQDAIECIKEKMERESPKPLIDVLYEILDMADHWYDEYCHDKCHEIMQYCKEKLKELEGA